MADDLWKNRKFGSLNLTVAGKQLTVYGSEIDAGMPKRTVGGIDLTVGDKTKKYWWSGVDFSATNKDEGSTINTDSHIVENAEFDADSHTLQVEAIDSENHIALL